MTEPKLSCPSCASPLTAPEVLEACSVSDAESGLVRFSCPRCGTIGFARLQDGRLELGEPSPVEGAPFRPTAAVAEPDLYVRRDAAWVDCWHRKVYRRFPVAV